jgi:outer membrane immunogenic protein
MGYAPAVDWSGFYIGGQGSWTSVNVTHTYDLVTPFNFNASGFSGGPVAGFNYQTGSWVLGLEGDVNFGNVSGTGLCDSTTVPACAGSGTNPTFNLRTTGTVRGRVGYAIDELLLYGTAGVGIADVSVSDPLQAGTDSKTHLGFVGGAGAEWMVTHGVSLRLEYLYSRYSTINYALVTTPDSVGFDSHSVRAALNIHF